MVLYLVCWTLAQKGGNFAFAGQGQVTMSVIKTGFVSVLEILESPEILLWDFPGLESPGK